LRESDALITYHEEKIFLKPRNAAPKKKEKGKKE
jgi:hypothetical protein